MNNDAKQDGADNGVGSTGGSAFGWNPAHPVGTCAQCGREMRYNVPRLGPGGGYVHADTGRLDCELVALVDRYIATATPEQIKADMNAADFDLYNGIGERIDLSPNAEMCNAPKSAQPK